MLKNKYKDDYQRIDAGQYQYIGKHYTLPMDVKQKGKCSWINLGTVAGFFLFEILAGCLNADSSRTAWIVFPYMFLFLPTAYMGIGAFAFRTVPLRMQHSEYQNSLVRMRRSCIAIMVLAALNAVLDLIYIGIHFSSIHLGREAAFLLCFLALDIIGFCYGKQYDRMYGGIVIDE